MRHVAERSAAIKDWNGQQQMRMFTASIENA
jgi:hypothetical protein